MIVYARWDLVELDLNMNGLTSLKHMFHSPGYGVYGIVNTNLNGDYLWEAKVLAKYRGTCDRAPICGIAPTLAGAKKIVETLCYETETCERKPKIVKNDLFEMILFFVQKCQDTKDKSHAHINDIQNIFGDKGIAKLVEMIDAKIILRCSNGMLLFSSK